MLRVLAVNPTVRPPSLPRPPPGSEPPLTALPSRTQTTLVGFSRYRTKLLLFYLLWIYAPPYPSRTTAVQPLPPHPPPTCTASASLSPRSSPSAALLKPDLPLGATPFSNDVEQDADLPSPLTAAYLSSASSSPRSAVVNSASCASSAGEHMPARGSTSRDLNASNESGPTPPLSEQPAAESAAASDALAAGRQRAAGRGAAQGALGDSADDPLLRRRVRREAAVHDSPMCSTTPPAPTSPRLTPLTYTLLAIHLLFLVELVLVNLETSPAMANLPSTVPSPTPRSTSSSPPARAPTRPPSSPSLAKRLARARWRISTIWTACGQELVVWAGAALVLGAIGATWRTGGGEGWNAVLGPLRWTSYLRLADGDEGSREGAKGWRVMRNVVALEVRLHSFGSPAPRTRRAVADSPRAFYRSQQSGSV